MEKLIWTLDEKLSEFRSEGLKFKRAGIFAFALCAVALLGTIPATATADNWFVIFSLLTGGVLLGLFGFHYLKLSIEQRLLGESLLLEREASLQDATDRLLNEIEWELRSKGE